MEFFGSGRTPRLGEYKNIGLYGIDQLAAAGTEKAKKTLVSVYKLLAFKSFFFIFMNCLTGTLLR